MVRARSLGRFYLIIAVLPVAALAQGDYSDNGCDWYCWVEDRIQSLQSQLDEISRYLFGDDQGQEPKPPAEYRPSTSDRYVPSTYGNPHITNNPPGNDYRPNTHTIVTVTSAAPGYPPAATQSNNLVMPEAEVEPRSGYRSLAYFGNWDIYARGFPPQKIPATQLTHLLYSFADNHDDGTVFLTDTWADTDIHYGGDSWSDSGKNVYGAIKQLSLLKAANRNLKVLLSIGGWTYTNEKKHMDAMAATDAGRKKFASSCVDMVKDYGFDGIDIDWEYPQDTTQGAQMLLLLKEVRRQLDEYADSLQFGTTDEYGRQTQIKAKFLLSIAAPAGEKNYKNMPLRDIAGALDFINLMAYDYAGSWDSTSGHSANLYPSHSNPLSTPYATDTVVRAYLAAGVPASKLNIGMPLYGRGFEATTGLGKPYKDVGAGTWEKGVYDFKALPPPGHTEYYDAEAGATYSFNNQTGELISYDTVAMALRKTDYVKTHGLGGAMWWEVSGDKVGKGSIISNVVSSLRGKSGKGIESSSNWLLYPDSPYDNIKNIVSGQ